MDSLIALGALTSADASAWRELAGRAIEPNPFFEPHVVLAAHAHLRPKGVSLLVSRDGGEWSACMPVCGFGRCGVDVALCSWMHRYAFLGLPLVQRDRPAEALGRLLAAAVSRTRSGLIVLNGVPADGTAGALVGQALAAQGLSTVVTTVHARATLCRRADGGYLAHLGSHHQREANRLGRRLEDALGASRAVADRASDPQAPEEFLRLEQSGWKGRQGTAMACRVADADFFRALCDHFRAEGRLQLLALQAGDQTVAMKCSLLAGDAVFCFKIAHDDALNRFSPGIQLERANVERFHADRTARWMDSCADGDNVMINRLWPDRRRIANMVVGRRDSAHRCRCPDDPRRRSTARSSQNTPRAGGPRPPRSTMSQLMTIDESRLASQFGLAPMAVAHVLVDHPLLEVDAVAGLAERLPADGIEHNLADLPTVVDPQAVRRSDRPVGDIAREIETNGCWMVLKNIERDPAYKALMDRALDEVAVLVSDREGGMLQREGFIFLSAPGSVTPSHIDPEHNLLLQVRGTKQMNVGSFPDAATKQLVLEDTLGGGHRNLSWEPVGQQPFALAPGDGVYVPPHAPHWVQNGPTASVSLSITFRTSGTERLRRVHAMNARLRRLGLSPRPPGEREASDRRKAACAAALGRLRQLRA